MKKLRKKGICVGIPKEIKQDEYRVAIVPAGVETFRQAGHEVVIQRGAGLGSGIADDDYVRAGARLVEDLGDVYAKADLILKVKEPLPTEYRSIEPRHVIFTFFHFAASKELTAAMLRRRATCVAYETIQKEDGSCPLLTPMSEVAGRMAIQEGAKYLEKPMEGRGILLGGVPGVEPAHVVILGGGIVGSNAARVAAGLGANVTLLDINLNRLRYLSEIMPSNVTTLYSNAFNIREKIRTADLLIGAVLIPGAKAPILVERAELRQMKPGSVIIDVAVDQGGCVETCHPTTHSKPTFTVDGVVHYCVANMPGAVGRTSTYALTNATLPYALEIANLGLSEAGKKNPAIACGVNLAKARICHPAVARSLHQKG